MHGPNGIVQPVVLEVLGVFLRQPLPERVGLDLVTQLTDAAAGGVC